jgi:phage protein D
VAEAARVLDARPGIAVGGRDQLALAEGLLGLRVAETVEGLSRCEATLGNWGARDGTTTFLYFDRALLDFGRTFTVSIAGRPVFDGRISGLEADYRPDGSARLTVLAEDRHEDLRTARRSRAFSDVTDAAVMRQIAAEHGLTADVELPGPRHRVLAQLNQSDLAFLRDRARAVEGELWMDGTTLRARPRAARAAGGAPPIRLGQGNELREVVVLADLAGQRTDVTVSGWDVAGKQALAGTADRSSVAGELSGGSAGADVLAAALGPRRERVVQTVPFTAEEARSRAEACYRRMARRFVTARGVADPSPDLRVGARVTLDGLGDLFTGVYYLSEVTHLFDGEQGLRTEFVGERAGLGGGRG